MKTRTIPKWQSKLKATVQCDQSSIFDTLMINKSQIYNHLNIDFSQAEFSYNSRVSIGKKNRFDVFPLYKYNSDAERVLCEIRFVISGYYILKTRSKTAFSNKDKHNFIRETIINCDTMKKNLNEILNMVYDNLYVFMDIFQPILKENLNPTSLANIFSNCTPHLFEKSNTDALSACINASHPASFLHSFLEAGKTIAHLAEILKKVDMNLSKSVGGRPENKLTDMTIKRLVDIFDRFHKWEDNKYDYATEEYISDSEYNRMVNLYRVKFVAYVLKINNISLKRLDELSDLEELPKAGNDAFVIKINKAHANKNVYPMLYDAFWEMEYPLGNLGFGFEYIGNNVIAFMSSQILSYIMKSGCVI